MPPRSPSGCATCPTSRPASASCGASSDRAAGSSASSCPCPGRASGAASTTPCSGDLRRSSDRFPPPARLRVPAGIAQRVPATRPVGRHDATGRPGEVSFRRLALGAVAIHRGRVPLGLTGPVHAGGSDSRRRRGRRAVIAACSGPTAGPYSWPGTVGRAERRSVVAPGAGGPRRLVPGRADSGSRSASGFAPWRLGRPVVVDVSRPHRTASVVSRQVRGRFRARRSGADTRGAGREGTSRRPPRSIASPRSLRASGRSTPPRRFARPRRRPPRGGSSRRCTSQTSPAPTTSPTMRSHQLNSAFIGATRRPCGREYTGGPAARPRRRWPGPSNPDWRRLHSGPR